MPIEQLTLATLNVQGLGRDMAGVRKRRELKEFFARSNPKPDILLIQEHKFTLRDCNRRLKQMDFLRGESYWNEA